MNGCVHLHFLKWILFISVVMVNIMKSYSQNKDTLVNNQKTDSTITIVKETTLKNTTFYRYSVFLNGVYFFMPTIGFRVHILNKPFIFCELFYTYANQSYNEKLTGRYDFFHFLINYGTTHIGAGFLTGIAFTYKNETEFGSQKYRGIVHIVPTLGVSLIEKRFSLLIRAGIGARITGIPYEGGDFPFLNKFAVYGDVSVGYNFNLRKKHENN